MSHEDGVQSAGLIHRRLKGKDADHEVQKTRHLGDATPVPCPDLGADVVENFALVDGFSECPLQTKVEAGIIDEHDGIWFCLSDGGQHRVELLPEVTVVF